MKEFVSLSPDAGPAVHEQPGELGVWKLSLFRQPAGQVSSSVCHSVTRTSAARNKYKVILQKLSQESFAALQTK